MSVDDSDHDAATPTDISPGKVGTVDDSGDRSALDRPESSAPSQGLPKKIGRYTPRKIIGQAGFGVVYLAFDEELQRSVAIKVPRADRIKRAEDIQLYLAEAQMVAALDHQNIVPVHDFGRTDDGMCFMVSKLIDGVDLATQLSQQSPRPREAARIVIAIADALHHAHTRRPALVHRDVKPGNILIDSSGKPYLTDFGLAIKEQDFGKGAAFAGTVPYMSPEQARWEGHRVDGRSDIFSLGSVFYELLTGEQPFTGYNKTDTLERIKLDEPRPLRQRNDSIPKELERICLKALAKRISDRYLTARDMAEELKDWISGLEGSESERSHLPPKSDHSAAADSVVPVTVRPKGLRSFDSGDADFFMKLLPGPRDREGIPESIRFWKSRIESTDSDQTFRVGVIYGPSGCGKSSLLKAGLLPLIDPSVAVIYTEATAKGTDTRLLHLLSSRFRELAGQPNLAAALAEIRRGSGATGSTKVLIVVDQFEQWLHNRDMDENQTLLDALRQCDGSRVQAVLTVRDDFWMGISRVMHDLEIDLVPGENVAAIDLFGRRHARKVLRSFGSALGALPDHDTSMTSDQDRFLDDAIDQLADDNKIIPVRLAFFTEMVKDRAWSPASLRDVGGAEGVGVAFLEDIFCGRSANPQHRVHEQAARRVLAALLPNDGGIIKGRMRSFKDLLSVSGYELDRGNFESLLRVLDNDLRLITPTESGAFAAESDDQSASTSESDRYYHLTHDYLVPALTDWLQQKQKETRRGRAMIQLDEHAGIWSRQRSSRQLPSFIQWLNFLTMTRRTDRHATDGRQQLLTAAAKHHGRRLAIAATTLLVMGLIAFQWNGSNQAAKHVNALTTARIAEVPSLVDKISRYSRWADPILTKIHGSNPSNTPARLRVDLALAPRHPAHREALVDWLWNTDPESFTVVCDSLRRSSDALNLDSQLEIRMADSASDRGRRFRAAAALARFNNADVESLDWNTNAGWIADELVRQLDTDPSSYPVWQPSFSSIGQALATPLAAIMRDRDRETPHRNLAATLLAEYAAGQPDLLVESALDATSAQYDRLLPALNLNRDRVIAIAGGVLDERIGPPSTEVSFDQTYRRQAHAAATLIGFDRQQRAWPLLVSSSDNSRRSYLVRRVNEIGISPELVFDQLRIETNPSIRASLVIILGGSEVDRLSESKLEQCVDHLHGLFERDPSSAVHSSAQWTLGRWHDERWLAEAQHRLGRDKPQPGFQWYITPEQITMTVVHGPVTVRLGSPAQEPGRDSDESIRTRTIERSFAVSTTEVTKAQFLKFVDTVMPDDFRHADNEFIPEPDCAMNSVSWFAAARYCRWISEQAGIADEQNCLPSDQSIHSRMSMPTDFLRRTGYRLPTEAEWEHVCRAGTDTPRYCGDDPELLPDYAWYLANSDGRSQSVGMLRPNDFGCFDILGNVQEWCHDRYESKPPTDGADIDHPTKINRELRVSKGAGFANNPNTIRAANRADGIPLQPLTSKGFRLARTLKMDD